MELIWCTHCVHFLIHGKTIDPEEKQFKQPEVQTLENLDGVLVGWRSLHL